MAAELTINEVAHIAEVPPRSVEKAIETGIMKPVKRRGMFTNTRTRFLKVDAVCYFAAVGHLRFLKEIPVNRKMILMKAIRRMAGANLEPLDLELGLRLDLPMIAGAKLEFARAYIANKKRHIICDPEIFGGVPIINGTRIPVYAIRGRLADGDTIDDLLDDYPEIPREAFIAADIYARTHPERGRPAAAGRPWEAAA
jgi:uncharacterized protein (DUF433 family)